MKSSSGLSECNFSGISWREQVYFHFVLDQRASFYSASSLKLQSVDRHVAHLDTLSCLRATKSLLFLLNAVFLVEKYQNQFYSLWFVPIRA
jgi:hypothetical protein